MELKSASNHNIPAFLVRELSVFYIPRVAGFICKLCRNCQLEICKFCEFWEGLAWF